MAIAREDATMIARGAPSKAAQIRRMIERLVSRHRLARAVFCPDDKLTPAAQQWLAKLAAENYVFESTFNGDRDRMLVNEGRRRLALEIINSTQLDVERLGVLTRMERENEHE
jgi:hypothetical protein